jgi:hypothetical protein
MNSGTYTLNTNPYYNNASLVGVAVQTFIIPYTTVRTSYRALVSFQ